MLHNVYNLYFWGNIHLDVCIVYWNEKAIKVIIIKRKSMLDVISEYILQNYQYCDCSAMLWPRIIHGSLQKCEVQFLCGVHSFNHRPADCINSLLIWMRNALRRLHPVFGVLLLLWYFKEKWMSSIILTGSINSHEIIIVEITPQDKVSNLYRGWEDEN